MPGTNYWDIRISLENKGLTKTMAKKHEKCLGMLVFLKLGVKK